MKKKILVTSISGKVGQSVLRTLSELNYNISIIGTDFECLESGMHLCDKVFEVPSNTDTRYVNRIKDICDIEEIDLIIPTHDLNVFYLSKNKDILPQIASSSFEIVELFFDKYKNSKVFIDNKIPFAESFLPSEYKNNFSNIIIKPRRGFGWKELHINPKNPKEFSDEFVIQKLYKGIEISTPFYVDKNNKLVGFINIIEKYDSFKRVCRIVNDFDDLVKPILLDIISKINISGICEIESIFDFESKKLIPFEVNCRFSNTTAVRSKFGFNDVKLLIDELIYNKKLSNTTITTGSSVRVFKDLIYKNINISEINIKQEYDQII